MSKLVISHTFLLLIPSHLFRVKNFAPLTPFVICWLGFQTCADLLITGTLNLLPAVVVDTGLSYLLCTPPYRCPFFRPRTVADRLPKDRHHHQPPHPRCHPNRSFCLYFRPCRSFQFCPSPRHQPLRDVRVSHWSYLHQRMIIDCVLFVLLSLTYPLPFLFSQDPPRHPQFPH